MAVSDLLADFQWPVAAQYRVMDGHLVANGKVSIRKPLNLGPNPPLYSLLLVPKPLELAVLAAAPICGMLTIGDPADAGKAREPLALWADLIGDLKRLVGAASFDTPDFAIGVNVSLDSRIRAHILPDTIADGIKIQLAAIISDGRRVFACEQCGAWTMNTRRNARFCSDTCRFAYHHARKLALRRSVPRN